MRHPTHTIPLSFRAAPTLAEKAERVARERDMTISELLRQALRREVSRGTVGSRAAWQ